MKRILSTLLLVTLSMTITSCHDEDRETPNAEIKSESPKVSKVSVLKSSKNLKDKVLISKLKNRLNNDEERLKKDGFNMKLELSENNVVNEAIISEYEGTTMKSITVPLTEDTKYVTYTDKGLLSEVELLIKVSNLGNNTYKADYFDIDNNLLGWVKVENGIIVDSYGFTGDNNANSNIRTNGFVKRWGKCVGVNMQLMSSGTAHGSAYAIGCIIFSVECGAGLAIGCAIGAAVTG